MFAFISKNLKPHHMNATLVYSSKWFPKSQTLVSWEPDNCDNLMRSIFGNVCKNRLKIERNKYFYKPSEDYTQYLVRFKGIRK
jgi:hypothetical protein